MSICYMLTCICYKSSDLSRFATNDNKKKKNYTEPLFWSKMTLIRCKIFKRVR